MILSHRAFLSGDLKACRGWPGRAWAEAVSRRHLSTGLGQVSGVSRARRVSTRSSFVIRGEFSQ